MQVSNLVLIIAAEIYLVLLAATITLLFFSFKQKKLIKRQQEKLKELLELINDIQTPSAPPAKSYGEYIQEQLTITKARFNQLTPGTPIKPFPALDAPLNQRITALRHAFLTAEAQGATEIPGSKDYWTSLEQALIPLLQQPSEPTESVDSELETYKKRVENLEKFKKLFFDLEERWNQAQANAQNQYDQLYAMADDTSDPELYRRLLEQYRDSYEDINQYIYSAGSFLKGAPQENKTINIIRRDPRAAEEILKLRNVAADQYRTISDLQRKLEKALNNEEKDHIIKELDHQLQRQVRFVQESDTCIQLLEEELHKANEKIAIQEQRLEADHQLADENNRIKQTLQNFALESKELLQNIESLEDENNLLKQNHEAAPTLNTDFADQQILETEVTELRKQYAELEEKYLELKLKQ